MPKSRIVMHQILARMWSDGAAHPLLVKITQSSHFVRQSVSSLATTHSHPRTQNWAPWPCPNELKTYLHTTARNRHLQQLYGEFPKLGCHKDTLQLVYRQTVVNLDNWVLSAVKRNRQTMKRCRRISMHIPKWRSRSGMSTYFDFILSPFEKIEIRTPCDDPSWLLTSQDLEWPQK